MGNYLDTRDLSKRLEELESDREDLVTALDDAVEALEDADPGASTDEINELEEARKSAKEALLDFDEEYSEELRELQNLRDEVPEWDDGNTLIPEDDWVDYVRELVEELGYISKDFPWWIHIDWEATAKDVAMDYGTVEFQGTDYYYRQ